MANYQDILKYIGYPIDILCLDFETFFSTEYSLKKLSTIEYIMDDRFELTGLGFGGNRIGTPDNESIFFFPDEIEDCLNQVDWDNITVLVFNARFDITILQEKFGIIPKFIIDIKDLASHYDARMSHKLADLAKMFRLKHKGDTNQFKGLHWDTMTAEQRQALQEYTINDVDLEMQLFKILLPKLSNPVIEVKLMRHTLDLWLHKRFKLDIPMAIQLKTNMRTKMAKSIKESGYTLKQLRSKKFVDYLQVVLPDGEIVPMKLSPKPHKKTGKHEWIPALAKDNEECQQLLVHPKQEVRDLVSARLGAKSWPTHIKRMDTMLSQNNVNGGLLRVPINYYGGHTGRWSGSEGYNLQNMGGRGRSGQGNDPLISQVRGTLMAQPGYTLGIGDSAQIEARILAWLAGQQDLLDDFISGHSPYCSLATELFGHEVRKVTDEEKQTSEGQAMAIEYGFGKDGILGCIAKGTPVLTNTGWKNIEDINIDNKLWDGVQWVEHAGIAEKGKRACVNVNGVWLTPEHAVINNHQWYLAMHLATDNQVSGMSMGSLSLSLLHLEYEVGLSPFNAVAPVVESLLRQETIWSQENLHAVMSVLKVPLAELNRLLPNFWMSQDMKAWLTEFVVSLNDAMILSAKHITDMVAEVLRFGPNGSKIEQHLLDTLCHCLDITTPNLKSTVLTTIKDTNQAIYDLQRGNSKLETQNVICYDILNAGPNRRFQAGNLIGENSGYGMGAAKFYNNCLKNPSLRSLFDSGQYDFFFIEHLIKTYRTKYFKIPEYWKRVEIAFKQCIKFKHLKPKVGQVTFECKGTEVRVTLPSSRVLYYRHCRIKDNTIRHHGGTLWGGSITENIDQSIARDLLGYWILECEKNGLPVVLHVHDEVVTMLSKRPGLDARVKQFYDIMCSLPDWAGGLPIGTDEIVLSERYKK